MVLAPASPSSPRARPATVTAAYIPGGPNSPTTASTRQFLYSQTLPHPPLPAPPLQPASPLRSPSRASRGFTSHGSHHGSIFTNSGLGLTSSSLYQPPLPSKSPHRGSQSARASWSSSYSFSEPPSPRPSRFPRGAASLVSAVLADPPLPLSHILAAGTRREPPPPRLSTELPKLPPMENRAEFLVRDPTQSRNALWTEFQSDVRHRLLHRNDPPPPPPPPPHVTNRGPRIKSKEPAADAGGASGTGRARWRWRCTT